jgi:hypothetical protein
LYVWKPWAILLRKISTIPTYIAKCYSKYSVCAMYLYSKYPFFIVQFEAHGKVGVHLCKLHVCHFISWS